MATINQAWRIASHPTEEIRDSNFKWAEEPLAALQTGQVKVRNIYLSLDPTNRIWMNGQDSYLPAVQVGDVMRGIGLGVVEEAKAADLQPGDIVIGLTGWQKYAVTEAAGLTKLPPGGGLPLTAYLSLFGHIGLTAHYGLLEIGQPKAGETVVVSTAAGAVGSLVGQIAKIKGCRVVGIAGSDEKCEWITKELGFDAAINYKTEKLADALQKHCPKGIDVYFDNVGGDTLHQVVKQMNLYARIIVCGQISYYNSSEAYTFPISPDVFLFKRLKMQGFIVLDHYDKAPQAFAELGQWLMEGKIKYRLDIVEGLENAVHAVNKLYDGSNKGKLIVKVSEEPKQA